LHSLIAAGYYLDFLTSLYYTHFLTIASYGLKGSATDHKNGVPLPTYHTICLKFLAFFLVVFIGTF